MRYLLYLLMLGCVATAQAVSFHGVLKAEWAAFKVTHNKNYDAAEDSYRFKVFTENKNIIAKHNALYSKGERNFEMKMNQFGDMLHHEFTSTMNGLRGSRQNRSSVYEPSNFLAPDSEVRLPDSVDWRTKGAVTPVKDQGHCGSCWAFSATGSLEGQHFLKTGVLVSLSEQNLVDCSKNFSNYGCAGGLMDNAFQYIKANGGIDTNESYPYIAQDGSCMFKKNAVGADDTGFVDIKEGDEQALKAAVATVGPVSVAIDASHLSMQFYGKGVYHEPKCGSDRYSLDHGMLAVGYGATEKGEEYWILKNSWNKSWGDDGYMLMPRNKNNTCGIATLTSYPLV